uniref:DedD protein n=1 Tax=Candidatus Kentrum eta TaxID=2126337 RepID=A0A450VPG2_9GAMM|nr:MAG: DedD protein [Candidatus Kentron sp. H]VFK02746.1 MAG: DedD protein [Candidatus Kentron sp. H]VFK06664.1 MAG: DedD protein [Candidatus Kentron sp. H]
MEQQLKHRLIGATVLVFLGVVFIPMILLPPKKADETFIDMIAPPEPSDPFRSRIVPLDGLFEDDLEDEFQDIGMPDRTGVEPETPIIPLPQTWPSMTRPDAKVIERQGTDVETPPGTATSEKSDSSSKVVTSTDPKPASSAWVVQVGSFSDQKNALRMRDRLRAKGYRAFVKSVKGNLTKAVTRVFVGPTLRREDALRASKKLRGDLDIKGIVMRYSRGR